MRVHCRKQTPGHFISQTRVVVVVVVLVLVVVVVVSTVRSSRSGELLLLLLLSLLCQFHFGNSLLHLTTNSIENLSRHSTSDGRRQRRGATLVEHRKFKNKFAATQQQSKGERGEWGNGGSTAKLSQRKLQFNSFEFVSVFLSLFLSACCSLALPLCLGAGQV